MASMLDKVAFRILEHIADQIQKNAFIVMSTPENLEEKIVENVLVKQHKRAHLQESPLCAGKCLAAAGDVQTVLEEQACVFRAKALLSCRSEVGVSGIV
jgi:hypothetical protein